MVGYVINLKDFEMPQQGPSDPKRKPQNYDVRRVIFGVMLSPNQQHKGYRFYTIGKVAKKIHECKEDTITLVQADYQVLKESFDNFSGFGPMDQEVVSRVYEAVKVDLSDKE